MNTKIIHCILKAIDIFTKTLQKLLNQGLKLQITN